MPEIVHRIGARAPLDEVFRAVSTPTGLAAWWTSDTTGEGGVGGKLAFRFGEVGGFDMEVLAADPDEGVVRWRVIDGPPEWIGTEIAFELSRSEDHTVVLFRHDGWRETDEFMHHCSTKWAVFLISLKELVETGCGRPHPHDVQISDWH